MEWNFTCEKGAVTVRQEEGRAVCQAISRAGEGGLYKAWLWGEGGRALLGTLVPEGGALRLRRSIEIRQLTAQGAWPPTGAEIVMAYAFTPQPQPPHDWCWTDHPGQLMGERVLCEVLRDTRRGLLRRDGEGFFLAFPYSHRAPFPIPPLFCLSRLERLGEGWYTVFRFSRQGRPELLHNFSGLGDNSTEA